MADLFISDDVHWTDKCQAARCTKTPVMVVRCWTANLWRWPLCADHRWHAEKAN